MSTYKIVLSKSAEKDLQKLPVRIVGKIIPVLQLLSDHPRLSGCKKLKGHDNLWRIRIGNYRVVYVIEDEIMVVDVRAIGHRKDVYE